MFNLKKKSFKTNNVGRVLFLSPAIILVILFFVFPLFFIAGTSMTNWAGGTFRNVEMVGLKNYSVLFTREVFWHSIRNTLVWAASALLLHLPLALITAMILSRRPRGWQALRVVYFFPQVIARISLALLWVFMFNVNYGPVNGMLRKVGLGTYALNWLGSDKTALMSVILSWMFYIGFYMIIFMASISTIPESIYESTYLDGAGPIKQDLYITFPMLKSTIIMCSMLAITSSFQNIEYPYMMTGGGPGSSTTTLPLLMYKNMLDNRAGIANALGVILVVVGVLIVFTIKKFANARTD